MVRKWFFTLSESSISRQDHEWRRLIRVAVKSASLNTDLRPHLIYDGNESPFIRELRTMGVTVIRHRVSFYDELAKKDRTNPGYLPICSAVFLRVELPLLEQEDEFVLFTDADVMFMAQPDMGGCCPDTFASAPQRNPSDYRHDINTGVMIMNLPALRRDLQEFEAFIVEHLNDGWPGCDQENYRRFYQGNWSRLPLEMNWKPYWGKNEGATIVHWHGPKPALVRRLREQPDLKTNPVWKELFESSPKGYEYFLGEWDRMAEGIARTVIGHLDVLSTRVIGGWAIYEDSVSEPVSLNVSIDNEKIGVIQCTAPRKDIEALYGTSVGGFTFALPRQVDDGRAHTVRIADSFGRPLELKYNNHYQALFRIGATTSLVQ